MKKHFLLIVIAILICLSFKSMTNYASSNVIVNDQIAKENYLEITSPYNDRFIDALGNLSYSSDGLLYTIFGSTMNIHYYDLFVEYDLNLIDNEFDKNDYFSGIEQLNLSTEDLKKDKLTIQSTKDLQYFKQQLASLSDGFYTKYHKLSTVEITFDKETRPTQFSFFDEEEERFYWYTIKYVSRSDYYSKYCLRKLSEPVFYGYYTIKHFFERSFFQGLIFSVIFFFSMLLFIWAITICISGAWKLLTKRKQSKIGKIVTIVVSSVIFYGILVLSIYSFLVLYPFATVCGLYWLFKRIKKK